MKKKCSLLIPLFLLLWGNSALAALNVFVSVPPQKWLVEQVGGDDLSVHVLVGGGQDPHTFEATPRQVAALSRADIWFTMGMEFEEILARKVKGVAPKIVVVNLARAIIDERKTGEEAGHYDHHDGHGHDDHDDHGHHDNHGHDGSDPHVWLSPLNLQMMGEETAHALSNFDQENRDKYTKNLKTLTVELALIHERIQKLLKPYAGKSFYVYHPSFGHFASTYGLVQEAVEIEGKSPGPRALAKLISKVKREKIRVLFVQPQFDQKSAQAIAAAVGGTVVPMDPLAENVSENLITMAEKLGRGLNK